MFRVILLIWIVPTSLGIIVKDPPPSGLEYKYSYNIDDPSTGDSKSQHEVRHGDVVSGSYTVVDPDGTRRTVDYTADSKKGFNAVVRTEPAVQADAPLKNNIDLSTLTAQGKAIYQAVPQPQQFNTPNNIVQNEVAQEPMHYVSPYEQEPRFVYFTPSNEIAPEDNSFAHGQYFIPAQTQ